MPPPADNLGDILRVPGLCICMPLATLAVPWLRIPSS